SLYLHAGRVVHWLTVGLVVLGCAPALAGGYFIEALVGCAVAALLAVVQWRWPHTFAGATLALLIAAAALAAVRVSTVALDTALLPAQGDIATGRAFPESVRILTPMFNIPGALILLVGAAVSAVRWREAPARLASNALIALGAFVPSLASRPPRLRHEPHDGHHLLGGRQTHHHDGVAIERRAQDAREQQIAIGPQRVPQIEHDRARHQQQMGADHGR